MSADRPTQQCPSSSPLSGQDAAPTGAADDHGTRFSRGMAKLLQIDGEPGRAVIDALADVAPDLGRYLVEFAFGDVNSRRDWTPGSGSWSLSAR